MEHHPADALMGISMQFVAEGGVEEVPRLPDPERDVPQGATETQGGTIALIGTDTFVDPVELPVVPIADLDEYFRRADEVQRRAS